MDKIKNAQVPEAKGIKKKFILWVTRRITGRRDRSVDHWHPRTIMGTVKQRKAEIAVHEGYY